jgi:hypothetical protein
MYSKIGEVAMWIRGTKYTVNHRSNKNSSVLLPRSSVNWQLEHLQFLPACVSTKLHRE